MLERASGLDWKPASVPPVLCRVLLVPPNGNNWSEYPNVSNQVDGLIYGCEWFKVSDFIEALLAAMVKHDRTSHSRHAGQFVEAINEFFIEEGIGCQLVDGHIVTRGTEAFEAVVTQATAGSGLAGRALSRNGFS